MRGSLTRATHFDKIRLTGSPAIFHSLHASRIRSEPWGAVGSVPIIKLAFDVKQQSLSLVVVSHEADYWLVQVVRNDSFQVADYSGVDPIFVTEHAHLIRS
jgi:hypothetical protein